MPVPDILIRRTLPEEYTSTVDGKRYLDDEEITVLSILDQQGYISSTQQIQDFMIIITRLERKVDHRAIIVEILTNRLQPSQAKEFVLFGGFRILKKWLKESEENDSLYEMMAIIKLCNKLPFDSNSVRISEIGKLIKKLQKYQQRSNQYTTVEVNEFLQVVNQLVDHWKEQLAAISKNKQQKEKSAQPADEVPSQQPEKVKISEKKEPTPVVKKSEPSSKPIDLQHLSTLAKEIPETDSTDSDRMDVEISEPDHVSLDSTVDILEPSAESKESNEVPLIPLTSSLPSLKPAVPKERKSLGMVEGARKLLAMRSQQVKADANTAASNNMTELPIDLIAEENKALPLKDQKPLSKGGIKKKDSKKEKFNIKWADEEGGLLREIYTIEVEKIKSSVATYKTHKDLVKKERQLEKETHLTKATEAMHRTTSWRIPKTLNLSIQITDNIGIPTASLERNIQNERANSVLEVRYLDESLIPPDPDEDVSMLESNDITSYSIMGNKENQVSNIIETIPWKIEGEEEEVEISNPMMMSMGGNNFPSSSSANGLNNIYAMGGQGGFNNGFDPSMGYYGPGGAGSSSGMTSDYDINTFVNALPLPLQTLDPFTLQLIIQDPSILQYLILPDGQTVHDNHLLILKNCTTLDEFYMTMNQETQQQQQQNLQNSFNSNILNQQKGGSRVSRWEQSNISNSLNVGGSGGGSGWGGSANAGMSHNNMSGNISSGNNWGPTTQTIISTPFITHSTRLLDGGNNNNNQWMGNDDMMMMSSNSSHLPTSSLSISSISVNSMSGGGSGHGRTSSKSQVACRFFNTPKGCMNGDKCKFGHFLDSSKGSGGMMGGGGMEGGDMNSGGGGGGMMGPGMRSGPGGGRLSGPGSMRHHLPGSTANSLSASILNSVMQDTQGKKGGAGGRPSKRAKH